MNFETFLFIIILIILIIYFKNKKQNNINNTKSHTINEQITTSKRIEPIYYEAKSYLTPNEYVFYHKLINVSNDYIVIPQIPLASIVKKINGRYRSELNRIIDFGIFDKNFNLLLLIELNDASHNKPNRIDRDLKVKKILDDCYIKLITFHTKYPNNQEYVTKRILENIKTN